jgi:hypothetical protein
LLVSCCQKRKKNFETPKGEKTPDEFNPVVKNIKLYAEKEKI